MGVNLVKGQKISLTKESGGTLSKVVVGLGWDPADSDDDIDLDASCLLITDDKRVVDTVWFSQLTSQDGSVRHTGDNLTGEGDGDDEQIAVDLSAVPAHVKHIVFVVSSFSGESFAEVKNAFCRVVDQRTGRELAKYQLSAGGSAKGMVIARVYRHNGEWKMAALGDYVAEGETVQDFLEIAPKYC